MICLVKYPNRSPVQGCSNEHIYIVLKRENAETTFSSILPLKKHIVLELAEKVLERAAHRSNKQGADLLFCLFFT